MFGNMKLVSGPCKMGNYMQNVNHLSGSMCKKVHYTAFGKAMTFYYKNLIWCKIKQRKDLIKEMHKELIDFSERRTLEEVKSHYFWHNQTKLVRELVQVRIVNWCKIMDR
jgi:hypothetical protein